MGQEIIPTPRPLEEIEGKTIRILYKLRHYFSKEGIVVTEPTEERGCGLTVRLHKDLFSNESGGFARSVEQAVISETFEGMTYEEFVDRVNLYWKIHIDNPQYNIARIKQYIADIDVYKNPKCRDYIQRIDRPICEIKNGDLFIYVDFSFKDATQEEIIRYFEDYEKMGLLAIKDSRVFKRYKQPISQVKFYSTTNAVSIYRVVRFVYVIKMKREVQDEGDNINTN